MAAMLEVGSLDVVPRLELDRGRPEELTGEDIEKRIKYDVFAVKGRHIVINGMTGSGKTQTLYYMADRLTKYQPGEVVVVLDVGKSHECLTFGLFKPLRFIIPEGCSIHIKLRPGVNMDVTDIVHVANPKDIWNNLDYGKINIVCFEAFIEDDATYTKYVAQMFLSLIKKAKRYQLPKRITVISDEFQNIAPSKNNALDQKHYSNGAKVQKNLDRVRSYGVRVLAAIQGWTMVRFGCRKDFTIIGVRRGGIFLSGDQPRLRAYNKKFERLEKEIMYLFFENKDYAVIKMPMYPEELGEVTFEGVFGEELDEDQDRRKRKPKRAEAPEGESDYTEISELKA
jgi:energy-coupling factor transporter ATP-binding protein EcfA2